MSSSIFTFLVSFNLCIYDQPKQTFLLVAVKFARAPLLKVHYGHQRRHGQYLLVLHPVQTVTAMELTVDAPWKTAELRLSLTPLLWSCCPNSWEFCWQAALPLWKILSWLFFPCNFSFSPLPSMKMPFVSSAFSKKLSFSWIRCTLRQFSVVFKSVLFVYYGMPLQQSVNRVNAALI